MSGSRADEDGQNSSWRPPGKPELQQLRRKPLCCRETSLGLRMPWLLILAICSSTLAESMQEGEPLVIKLNYMATILMIMMPRKMQIVMIEVLCHYKWAL